MKRGISRAAKAVILIAIITPLLPVMACAGLWFLFLLLPYPADADSRYHLLDGHPTDIQFADNLRSHQAEFDRLIYLYRKVDQLSNSSYECKKEAFRVRVIDVTECQEFVELLEKTGVRRIFGGDVVILVVSERGLGVSGSEKGYMYHAGGKPQMPSGEYHDARNLFGDWWVYDFAT